MMLWLLGPKCLPSKYSPCMLILHSNAPTSVDKLRTFMESEVLRCIPSGNGVDGWLLST